MGSYEYAATHGVFFNEDEYEKSIIEYLHDELGYEYRYGPDVARTSEAFDDAFLPDVIQEALWHINPDLSSKVVEAAIDKLKNIEGATLISKNKAFMDMLQNGVEVRHFDGEDDQTELVKLIDYENPKNNSFFVVNQWTYIERGTNKRPDVIVFVNGLPLVVFELKSPARIEADNEDAYQQLQNYKKQIPTLFVYNAFCVISDMLKTKVGTITSNESRFQEWKSADGSYESTQIADWKTPLEGMFPKDRIIDIVKNFILYASDQVEDIKILAGYHQYFAVKKALVSVEQAIDGDKKGGVFWHTQGSGKSLSMVFLAHLLDQKLNSPTIVVITDRNDLDSQLFEQFADCKDFLRQTPIQAQSRQDLAHQIASRKANGIIFTTMQKFTEGQDPLSDRTNVVVMVDEAHRGQYGFEEKYDKDGQKHIGTALLIRRALPNATFIGFTGTPISMEDRSTKEIFGDYIDVYDMTQAVEDNATRPVFYESRVVALNLDENILKDIDDKYEELTERANIETINASKRELANMDAVLSAPEVIDSLCEDIVDHYEMNRATELTGKAMIVAYSRQAAMKIYYKLLELRPKWKDEGKIAVVMTHGNGDPEEWFDVVGNKAAIKEKAKRFKDDDDPLKIVIVVDMWLTGFDVPSLATMYIYKPLKGYNLMQAIARVNRVYKGKEGGLVVDYIGIANALKRAMKDYTKRDQKNYGDMDIGATALPKFYEKLAVCRDMMFGFEYEEFMKTDSAMRRSELITDGVNFILGSIDKNLSRDFIQQAQMMLKAYGLAKSRVTNAERAEVGYFQVVRELILQLTEQGFDSGNPDRNKNMTLKQVNETINSLLEQNIVHSKGVINLFKVEDESISLFDQKFLSNLSSMKERNLAYEMLKKLLSEQIKVYNKKSVVQAKKYSELMQGIVNSYLNGQLTNTEVFEEMIKMAKEMFADNEKAKELGLNDEEYAFYEALTEPRAIADYYENKNEELIKITQALTSKMREMRTVDWQKKKSARAAMKVEIKKLLRLYDYPPEGRKEALETVMKQCEMWADNAA